MLREKLVASEVEQGAGRAWLGGRGRWVSASVVVRGHEVDAFDASSPKALTLALAPILTHLPDNDYHIDYMGLSTRWGLFGLRRRTEMTPLADRVQAMAFLDGVSAFGYPRPSIQDTTWLGRSTWAHGSAKGDQTRARLRPRMDRQEPSRRA
jgi:hypothetical protein